MHYNIRSRSTLYLAAGLLLVGLTWGAEASATTYTVGAGKTFLTPEQIVWSDIHPGDSIVIYPGTYPSRLGTGNSMTVTGVVGTAAQPITVEGSSGTDLPLLTGGILVDNGSQYVHISNVDVARNPKTQPYAAVVVRGKSGNLVLSNLNVHNSYVGVEFTQAGLQNTLQNSEVYDNVMHGMTLGAPDVSLRPDADHPSHITNNTIHDNGAHGMEVTGPYWTIEKNSLKHNGTAEGGTSGIHLFSLSDVSGPDTCNNNRILYNYVSYQQDSVAADGNGIQIDDFCDSNMVAFNVVWQNAGAGISVLNAAKNTIIVNSTYANAQDESRAAKFPGVFRGEIIIGSMDNLCGNANVLKSQCHPLAGSSSGNVIADNIIVSGQAGVPGIFVSTDAVLHNTNTFYANLYHNFGGGTGIQLLWDNAPYYSASTIDSVTGQAARGGGNLVEAPHFLNVAAPGSGYDGLRLIEIPSKNGRATARTTPDMLGKLAAAGTSYFGAYYTSP